MPSDHLATYPQAAARASRRAQRLLCVFAGCLILLACAGSEPTPAALQALIGPEWIAREIDGSAVMDQPQSTLLFERPDRVVGDTACNRYFGPWTVTGARIDIGPLGSSRRACAPEVMDQEQRFLAALEDAATWTINADDCLYLGDDSGAVLIRLCPAGGM